MLSHSLDARLYLSQGGHTLHRTFLLDTASRRLLRDSEYALHVLIRVVLFVDQGREIAREAVASSSLLRAIQSGDSNLSTSYIYSLY